MSMGSQEAQGLLWGAEPAGWQLDCDDQDGRRVGRRRRCCPGHGRLRAGQFMPQPPPGGKPGGPFRLSGPGVLEAGFTSAGIDVSGAGEVNCPFVYESWDSFWRGARAAGPTQMAIGRAGSDAVESATRTAVEPLTAEDGTITFETNMFIYVVGRA